MSTRELIEKEVANLTEALQREVFDFARFLRMKDADEHFNGLLLSESALAKDWNSPEEDAAWASLQSARLLSCLFRKQTCRRVSGVLLWWLPTSKATT